MNPALRAEVAELADAHDSGSCARKGVGVQIPPSAPDLRDTSPDATTSCVIACVIAETDSASSVRSSSTALAARRECILQGFRQRRIHLAARRQRLRKIEGRLVTGPPFRVMCPQGCEGSNPRRHHHSAASPRARRNSPVDSCVENGRRPRHRQGRMPTSCAGRLIGSYGPPSMPPRPCATRRPRRP
jgi:hypothetical protein